MRRRDRELNIFSMSALDLFASAMGAFILITLILMPYYLKNTPTQEPTPVQQICPAEVPIPDCPVCPKPLPVPDCPEPTVIKKIADNLLVMQMEWDRGGNDVDLYVKSPDGEFYYGNKTISGKPGKFTLDNQDGGENSLEIWMAYNPTPGDYVVYFKFCCHGPSSPVKVGGRMDKPHGPTVIPKFMLSKGVKTKVLAFTITREYDYRETFKIGS